MDTYGALIGWTHQDFGDKLLIRLESVRSSDTEARADPDCTRILLTKQQAAVLGNNLMEIAGATPPTRAQRKLLRRLFG